MLDRRSQDLPATYRCEPHRTLDGEVVTLSCPARKNDLTGGGADCLCYFGAGPLYCLRGLASWCVDTARWVRERLDEKRQHRLHNTRVTWRGGVIIQVHRLAMRCSRCAMHRPSQRRG